MENDRSIRIFEFDTIIYFLMRALVMGISLNACIEIAKVDAWISIIIGFIIGFIPFYIFNKIHEYEPNKNIMEVNLYLFGKVIGKLINIIITLFCLSVLSITLWNLTNFISSQYLYNTPQIFIAFLFTIPTIYLLSKNYKIIGRTMVIFFIMEIILYILSVIGLAGQVKFTNIYPILENGFSPVIKASFIYVVYNTLTLFLTTSFPLNNIKVKSKKSFKKHLLLTYILSNLSMFITVFCLISIFGVELARLYQYPIFQLLRRVEFGGFIQRAESTLSIHWIISIFAFNFLCFIFIKEGLNNIFNHHKIISKLFPFIVIGITYLSTLIFKDNTFANEFTTYYFIYFMGFFFFLIPIIILIFSKLKSKK